MRQEVSTEKVLHIIKYLCNKYPANAKVIAYTGARILGVSIENFAKAMEGINNVKN